MSILFTFLYSVSMPWRNCPLFRIRSQDYHHHLVGWMLIIIWCVYVKKLRQLEKKLSINQDNQWVLGLNQSFTKKITVQAHNQIRNKIKHTQAFFMKCDFSFYSVGTNRLTLWVLQICIHTRIQNDINIEASVSVR